MSIRNPSIEIASSNDFEFDSFFCRRSSERDNDSVISTSMSVATTASQLSALFRSDESDRLISDQGLITRKNRSSTSFRRIRDKSYYKGLIYSKNKEISDEIKKLQKEISLLNIDRSTYLPFKKKAELKVSELKSLQKTLADYNCLDDMLNRDLQLDDAKVELIDLITGNRKENAEVENLFDKKTQKEAIIKEMETDISQEDYVSEILTTTMNPQLREKYRELKRTDDQLQRMRINQEEQLINLIKQREELEEQCNEDEILKEGIRCINNLWLLEKQRQELFSEKKFTSLAEEREYLHKYKTECTDILKGIVQESRSLDGKIKAVINELSAFQNETTSFYSERVSNYSKLKLKEQIIDEFLSSYSNKRVSLLTEQQQLECKIKELLKNSSCKLNCFKKFSQNDESRNVSKDQDAKVVQMRLDLFKATAEWNSVNELEQKCEEEMNLFTNEIAAKEKAIFVLSDIEDAKRKLKNRQKGLSNELKEIKKQTYTWRLIIKDLKKNLDTLKRKLENDQTYKMLSTLENKWHSLEEENFSMQNFIECNKVEKSYLLVKEEVRKLYSELNNMLQKE